ncbi:hypothetical protein [Hyphomicrobium sp. DY-1]|uniref:hypothetical protein n=1 Tax=Hyphomicrobium sp. DY-1 TaxID=3075650 RepID=UPI0039C2C196
MTAMNASQRVVCKAYGGGDFNHYADDPDWRHSIDQCGDTLFRFLMIELSDAEECEDAETALRRLTAARTDIEDAIDAVARLSRH